MNNISAVSNPFSGLNTSRFINHKVKNFINERDTNDDNTLNISESGVSNSGRSTNVNHILPVENHPSQMQAMGHSYRYW